MTSLPILSGPRFGARAFVDGFGLRGATLLVGERHGEHFALHFAHNGNRVPGFYHAALLRAA